MSADSDFELEKCLLRADWLAQISEVDLSPTGLSDIDLASLRTVQRLAGEYLTFAYLMRTLLEFFDVDDDSSLRQLQEAAKRDENTRTSLDYLARARQHLTVNPHLAWEQISKFREETPSLQELPFPENLLNVQRPPKSAPAKAAATPQ